MIRQCFHSRYRRKLVIVAIATSMFVYIFTYTYGSPVHLQSLTTASRTSTKLLVTKPVTQRPPTTPRPVVNITRLHIARTKPETRKPLQQTEDTKQSGHSLKHINLRRDTPRPHISSRDRRVLESRFGGRIGRGFRNDVAFKSPYVELQELKARPRDMVERPALIAVLAYMHTGSSYVGSVFQNHPGTYYEYEPLRSLQALSRNNEATMWLNGTTRHMSGTFVEPDIGAEAVANMLQCSHDLLDMTTLIKYYRGLKSRELRDQSSYFRCQARRMWLDTKNPSVNRRQALIQRKFFTASSKAAIVRCLPLLTLKCEAAKVHVSKFIRMTMDIGEGVMSMLPDVRIVHLLRDPRAMMDSQVRKGDMGTRVFSTFVMETALMCRRMLDNINLQEKLEVRYPGRLLTIRYEDILEAPIRTAESMFNFTGLSFTDNDAKFVRHFSIDTGKNSTQREAAWKYHLDQSHLDVLNEHCREVYDKVGYIYYENIDDIRNISNPTYTVNPEFSVTTLSTGESESGEDLNNTSVNPISS